MTLRTRWPQQNSPMASRRAMRHFPSFPLPMNFAATRFLPPWAIGAVPSATTSSYSA